MTGSVLAYAALTVAILSEVVATSALKASDGFTRLTPSAIVIAGYGLAFILLAQTLRVLPVGVVYAIWAGLGVVGVAFVGTLFFGEAFGMIKAVGIAMIISGVVVVHLAG